MCTNNNFSAFFKIPMCIKIFSYIWRFNFLFIFSHTYSFLFRIYEKVKEVTWMVVDEYEISPEELRRYLDDLYN